MAAWLWNGDQWVTQHPSRVPSADTWLVEVHEEYGAATAGVVHYRWRVNFRDQESTASVASLRLALDQLRWAIHVMASWHAVQPPPVGRTLF